jgi:hypothetical protein
MYIAHDMFDIDETTTSYTGAQTLHRSDLSCPLLKIKLLAPDLLILNLILLAILFLYRGGTDRTNLSALPNLGTVSRSVKYS